MSYNMIFEAKNPLDVKLYEFEFGDQLLFGEIITSAAVAASVYTGTDPTPNAIVSGDPIISGTKVQQLIEAGVDGVIYNLVATVNASGLHVYTKAASLAVISPASEF